MVLVDIYTSEKVIIGIFGSTQLRYRVYIIDQQPKPNTICKMKFSLFHKSIK